MTCLCRNSYSYRLLTQERSVCSLTGHGGHQHSQYLPEISENKAKSFLHYRHIRSLDPNASPHPDYCTYLYSGYETWCERHIPYCQGQQEFTREHRCATLTTPCSPGHHCVLTTPCPAHFTHNCVDIDECDSNPCQNGGTCHNGNNQYTCTCLPGWTGTNCEIDINECDNNPCQNGGTCHNGNNQYTCTCLPGWTGTNCKNECKEEWFGVNCSQQCVGHCRGSTTCNHVTGHCDDGCAVGFKGPKCEKECDNGTYGYDCVSNCSGHCLNGSPCNKQTGHCDKGCKLGYTSDDCSKACYQSYGENCQFPCSQHCRNKNCSIFNGTCLNGCTEGFYGEKCDKDIPYKHDASSSTTWMIGFSISFAVNVILIILGLACLWGIYTKKVSFFRSTTESVYCENTVTKTEETSNYQELNFKEDMAYQNSKENMAYENLTLQ